jgi:hypothetical protein
MRHLLGLGAATLAASFGALVLGEYELKGAMGVLAAVLFGLAIAEALVSVGRRSTSIDTAVSAALGAAAFVWSAWISAGRDWSYVSGTRWAGVPIAAAAAAFWVRSSGRRAAGSPPTPSRTPAE